MSTALTQLHHHTTARAGAVARRNLFLKSVDRICGKESSVIGQISSTLLVGKF